MISPSEIRIKSERKYLTFLSSLISGDPIFPLEISFVKVKASETLDSFDRLKKEIEDLRKYSHPQREYGYTVEFSERRDRKIGVQQFPARIYFSDKDNYSAYLGKKIEVAQFIKDCDTMVNTFPQLKPLIIYSPQFVIENKGIWDSLLKVCLYFDGNPKPDLHIRELPVEVDTKFIEKNKKVLRKLLDIILNSRICEESGHFETRFGLKYNEPLIRMRILDSELAENYFSSVDDLSMPLSQFRNLIIPFHTVIILENINNFLTLPALKGAVAIFGSGFKVSLLKGIDWLENTNLVYWGDIDTHGFQILSQVRGYYPHIQSFLMDKKTFETFSVYHVQGADTSVDNPVNLTSSEKSLYNLLFKTEGRNRLEQEKISQEYVLECIEREISCSILYRK